ncbi:MAG TPA: bacillithiol biosynthesis BshC, partial [Thermoanaerobaculia bacterium]
LPVAGLCVQKQVNRQLDLVCMRAIRSADQRATVGSLPVPESLIAQLLSLYDLPRPPWLRPGINFRDSFAGLLASVFGNELVLVDALTPELRRAAAPLFGRIAEKHDDIQHALQARARELAQAGYAQQVVPPDGEHYTLFFALDKYGVRHPVAKPVEPERTSTSALTRPLLQDDVLQPDVFVGGPSEVAYYAQLAPLHQMLGVTMPRVALRGHALVAPKRVARTIERYHVEPRELFASPDALLIEREPEGVAQIREIAASARASLMQHIEAISELALPADHSLAGSIRRSVGHLEYHFDKLSERAIKGLVRKDRERLLAVRELAATFHPDAHVQDRIVGWFGWWCEYGEHLTRCLIDEIEPDSDVFRIISL